MGLGPDVALLTDRVAIVTGAAAGIGKAISIAFARFGADLALCDRDADGLAATARAVEGCGRRTFSAELDVRDGDAVALFLAATGAELGSAEVLVNNAGGGFAAPFLEVSARGQEALVHENFTSVTHFVRGFVRLVPPAPEGGASIVNITSIEAHRAAPGYAVYAAMKAAVANLTCSLALELGDRGIRVNCIAPDLIPTPGIGDPPLRAPLARNGHVDDVAGAAVFLASDLSRFVTGATLHVDGGGFAAGGWRRSPDGGFEL